MIKLEMKSKYGTFEQVFENIEDVNKKIKELGNAFTNYSITINNKVIVNNKEIV